MGFGFWVSGFGVWVRNFESWWVLDLSLRFRAQDTGFSVHVSGQDLAVGSCVTQLAEGREAKRVTQTLNPEPQPYEPEANTLILHRVSGTRDGLEGRCKATWKREFKLPWRKAGPLKSSR